MARILHQEGLSPLAGAPAFVREGVEAVLVGVLEAKS